MSAPAPANPFAREVAGLRGAVVATLRPADLADVTRALLKRANGGDVAAARLLLSYALGKPGPAVDPDRLDFDEWQLLKAAVPLLKELPALLQTPSPSFPLTIVR